MKKLYLILLVFCIFSREENVYSQNIDKIAGIHGRLNQVFDVYGNMYYIESGGVYINKMEASTGATSRYAGSATAVGYHGDGGPASLAQIDNPYYLAINSAGDLFIADNNNSVIRKVDHSTGIITTVAGNGTSAYSGDGGAATAAQIEDALGIRFSKDKSTLFIAEHIDNVIRAADIVVGGNFTWRNKFR